MPAAVFVPAQLNDLAVDVALTSVARGDVLYRGASKWNNLGVGTSGQFLKTNGAGADPAWATVDLTTLVTLAPGSSTRNVVQPSGDFKALIVKNNAAQTVDPFETQDSAGNRMFLTLAAGGLYSHKVVGISRSDQVTAEGSSSSVRAEIRYNTSGQMTITDGASASLTLAGLSFASATNANTFLRVNDSSTFTFNGNASYSSSIGPLYSAAAASTGTPPTYYTHTFDTNGAVNVAHGLFGVRNHGDALWELIGSGDMMFRRVSSTTTGRETLDLTVTFATATDASRKARAVFNVWDTAAREAIRLEASGTAAMIGFLGAAAVVRQTAAAAATDLATVITLANSLRTGVIANGLFA